MSWFLYNFLLKYLCVFLMSMVSSKCQLGHVETINFSTRQQMNKIAWNVSLKHLTAPRATRASKCFTGMKGKIFLILRGRDFDSEKSFTLPVPFPSVYFHLLNNILAFFVAGVNLVFPEIKFMTFSQYHYHKCTIVKQWADIHECTNKVYKNNWKNSNMTTK